MTIRVHTLNNFIIRNISTLPLSLEINKITTLYRNIFKIYVLFKIYFYVNYIQTVMIPPFKISIPNLSQMETRSSPNRGTYNLKIGVVPLSDEQLQWICVGQMSSKYAHFKSIIYFQNYASSIT